MFTPRYLVRRVTTPSSSYVSSLFKQVCSFSTRSHFPSGHQYKWKVLPKKVLVIPRDGGKVIYAYIYICIIIIKYPKNS